MAVELGWYLAPPLIAGFVSAAIGSYVLYKNPRDTSTHVFFILMIAVSIWMFGEFAMQVSSSVTTALRFGKISNLGYVIMPVALLHFTLVYPTIAFKKEKTIIYLGALYGPTLLVILVLLLSNQFFTVDTGEYTFGPDSLVDGDGPLSTGSGSADGPNGTFRQLAKMEPDYWFYYDANGDGYFNFSSDQTETLTWNNFDRGLSEVVIIGRYGENQILRKSLLSAQNSDDIYWQDSNDTNGSIVTEYDPGEDIYLDDNNYSGIQTDLETVVKFIEENYRYKEGSLYFLFILFFFAFIIGAILNILSRLLKAESIKERAQMSYLSAGLIFIIFYIISYYFLGNYVSVRVLEGVLAITIALFFAIAVLKYNLMDIELIIKKSLFYSIIFMVIAGIFVIIGEVMEALIGSVILPGSQSIIPNILSAIVVAIIFIPLTKQVRRFTDWLFPEARKYEKEYQDRLVAYEATFEAMLSDGKISMKEKEALQILRKKLDISEDEHSIIKEKLRKIMSIR